MTREHVAISAALEVPLFIVVTKTDLGPHSDVVNHITQMLTNPGIRKVIAYSLNSVVLESIFFLFQQN